LERCLLLDGYRIDDGDVRPIDPTVEAFAPIEDDLTEALERSGLPSATEMMRLMNNSGDHVRSDPRDYNASQLRHELRWKPLQERLRLRGRRYIGATSIRASGQVIAYLRTSRLITGREELGLTGVYSFISEGAHVPVGMTAQDMVQLGRNLAAGLAYFLIKRFCVPDLGIPFPNRVVIPVIDRGATSGV